MTHPIDFQEIFGVPINSVLSYKLSDSIVMWLTWKHLVTWGYTRPCSP